MPFLLDKKIRIAEIISDYRQPRPGDPGDCCQPGTWGYESEIPRSVKEKDIWIKCMNSPVWVRKNIGDPAKKPGRPYQDPEAFGNWVSRVIGSPEEMVVVLFGMTLDCCVLATAQEFRFRGFNVKILREAVDTYSGSEAEKDSLFESPIPNWAEEIRWETLRGMIS